MKRQRDDLLVLCSVYIEPFGHGANILDVCYAKSHLDMELIS